MQTSGSLSSIASSASSNSSLYGSRTVLNIEELHTAAPRCRSSIVSFVNNDQTLFSPPSSPPPLPPPRRRQTQLPSLSSSNKSMVKCRQLFRTCLSSTASPLQLPNQSKLSDADRRQEYFAKLCQTHRLLLVLNDYECQCGCRFSMEQGSYVILYESANDLSVNNHGLVTVISNDLVCSKVPRKFLCDVESLRERVRSRRAVHHDDELTFDL